MSMGIDELGPSTRVGIDGHGHQLLGFAMSSSCSPGRHWPVLTLAVLPTLKVGAQLISLCAHIPNKGRGTEEKVGWGMTWQVRYRGGCGCSVRIGCGEWLHWTLADAAAKVGVVATCCTVCVRPSGGSTSTMVMVGAFVLAG